MLIYFSCHTHLRIRFSGIILAAILISRGGRRACLKQNALLWRRSLILGIAMRYSVFSSLQSSNVIELCAIGCYTLVLFFFTFVHFSITMPIDLLLIMDFNLKYPFFSFLNIY